MEPHSPDRRPPSDLELPTLGAMPTRGVLALRTALQALLRSGTPDDGVRHAMELFCAEARRRELRAERVLVLLKEVWQTLPEVRRLGRAEREQVLAHITTLAIRTYYEPTARAPDPTDDRAEPR